MWNLGRKRAVEGVRPEVVLVVVSCSVSRTKPDSVSVPLKMQLVFKNPQGLQPAPPPGHRWL